MYRAAQLLTSVLITLILVQVVHAASPNIVISQVYGGGGNSGATLRNDFIELFNRGTTTIDVTGWTVQYASASGTSWVSTPLNGSIAPGRYFLVQEQQGAGGTQNLPAPDAIGSINLSATAGKVALVNSSALLNGSCPSSSSIVDLVGYGSADCSEGSPAPTLGNTTSALRAGGGCTETDSNSSDFSAGPPNPRNASSPSNPCGTTNPTNPTGTGSAAPSSAALGGSVLLIVAVTPGTNPASTGITVAGNLTPLGGTPSQSLFEDGTNGDVTAGDSRFSFRATISNNTTVGPKTIAISISDVQGRTGVTTIQVTVVDLTLSTGGELVFPHIADGGGYKTVLLLTNSTGITTTATITFFASSGTPLDLTIGGSTASSFSLTIQARGSAKLETSGNATSVCVGWAKVTTSPPVELQGNALFQLFNGSTLFSEASVPAAPPTSVVDFFADEDGGFNTGFAMANPGTTTAAGTLTLRSTSGTTTGVYSISLPPNQHAAIFLFQILSGASSGRAEINLTQGALSVTALRFHTSSVFSTVSVGTPGAFFTVMSALFSPNGGVRNRIIAEIDRAKSTIDIAIYSFTSDEIRDGLVSARNRGVAIRILADSSQAGGTGSEITTLESLGFNLKRSSGGSGGIMHNKYMIIDGGLLLTGSYNWSANAENNNFENAVFVQGSQVVQSYVSDFNKIWSR